MSPSAAKATSKPSLKVLRSCSLITFDAVISKPITTTAPLLEVGVIDGGSVGSGVGTIEGMGDGDPDGRLVGTDEGMYVGNGVGRKLGTNVGTGEGLKDVGENEGDMLGNADGSNVGSGIGEYDG